MQKNTFLVRVVPPLKPEWFHRSSANSGFRGAGGTAYFLSGRLALLGILQSVSRDRDRGHGEVLLPAYVCNSVVDACEWAGLTTVRYRLNTDLSIQFDDLQAKITPQTIAVIAIHYFGFPAQLEPVSHLCSKRRITLIEDAAHVDWGSIGRYGNVGQHGDWLFCSLRKFASLYDGAVAVPVSSFARVERSSRPIRTLGTEMRSVKNNVSAVVAGSRHQPTSSADFEREGRAVDVAQCTEEDMVRSKDYIDTRFSATGASAMTLSSRILFGLRNAEQSFQRRRDNYSNILSFTLGLTRGRPLFSEIPDGASPYIFPMIFDRPDIDYPKVRAAGVEALRWEDLVPDGCQTCNRYEQHLIQVPCHDQLSADDLEFLKSTLRSILT